MSSWDWTCKENPNNVPDWPFSKLPWSKNWINWGMRITCSLPRRWRHWKLQNKGRRIVFQSKLLLSIKWVTSRRKCFQKRMIRLRFLTFHQMIEKSLASTSFENFLYVATLVRGNPILMLFSRRIWLINCTNLTWKSKWRALKSQMRKLCKLMDSEN